MESCYGGRKGSCYGDTATVNGCHSLFANNRTPVFLFCDRPGEGSSEKSYRMIRPVICRGVCLVSRKQWAVKMANYQHPIKKFGDQYICIHI